MSLAVVKADIAPLFLHQDDRAWLADELLCGMTVEVLDNKGALCSVRTAYRYEGMVPSENLWLDCDAAREWAAYGKLVARAPFVDVLCAPDAESARVLCLPRGGLVHQLGEADEAGFVKVGLPANVQGFAKLGNLMAERCNWKNHPEEELREALATTALSYLGAQYRYGGKTPLGIDCSGLVSMAYLLNGAIVWRDADWRDGFDLHEVPREKLARGDVLYFAHADENHAALYLGDDMYVHATGQNGSDGVVLNSLRPDSPFYRADLSGSIARCASLF